MVISNSRSALLGLYLVKNHAASSGLVGMHVKLSATNVSTRNVRNSVGRNWTVDIHVRSDVIMAARYLVRHANNFARMAVFMVRANKNARNCAIHALGQDQSLIASIVDPQVYVPCQVLGFHALSHANSLHHVDFTDVKDFVEKNVLMSVIHVKNYHSENCSTVYHANVSSRSKNSTDSLG